MQNKHLVVLSGNSTDNSPKIIQALGPFFRSVDTIHYEHWGTAEPLIDILKEVEKLPREDDGSIFCFTKSAGALVAILGIKKGIFHPIRCIFTGFPLLWARKNGFDVDNWIADFSVPTLILQKTNDPVTSYAPVADYFKDYKNVTVVEISGEDHQYENFDEIIQIATEKGFLGK